MGILDKDRLQKQKAVRYCISNGLLPYLEVVVGNIREISDTKTVITDIDVLGIEISRRGDQRRTLFDCKTVAKMSPINRAFWASGVMTYTNCAESYVILSKKASEAHRVSAKSLNVHLFQEQDFDTYAQSANINYLDILSYTALIENWYAFYNLFQNEKNLKDLGEFINTKIPLENDHAKALRELLGSVRNIKGELDPEKNEHMSIYTSIVLSFNMIMSCISTQIFDLYETDMTQSKYEKLLRYYIWGGRESYILRRDLKNSFLEATGGKKAELELPGWSYFIYVSRLFLDSPTEIKDSLIPCREISLRFLTDASNENDKQLSVRLNRSNRIRQYVLAASDYICKATGMPADFHSRIKDTLTTIDECI